MANQTQHAGRADRGHYVTRVQFTLTDEARRALANDLRLLRERGTVWEALKEVATLERYGALEEGLREQAAGGSSIRHPAYFTGLIDGVQRYLATIDRLVKQEVERQEQEAAEEDVGVEVGTFSTPTSIAGEDD